MRLKKMLLFFWFFTSTILFAQNCDLNNSNRTIAEAFANQAGNDLMSCCSEMGGKNMETEVYYGNDDTGKCKTYVNNGTLYYINMKVSWTGGLSGRKYWIKGILTYNILNSERKWTYISDSKGFNPGCSKNCIE